MTVQPFPASRQLFARLFLCILLCWSPTITTGAPFNSLSDYQEIPNNNCLEIEGEPSISLEEETQIIVNPRKKNGACQHIAQCDIMTSPTEAEISWFAIDDDDNEHLISLEKQHDYTFDLDLKPQSKILGNTNTISRICLDPFVPKHNRMYRFKCKAKLRCDSARKIESGNLLVVSKIKESRNHYHKRLMPKKHAPLITTFTNSRMEYIGEIVQMSCHATGNPQPKIQWEVIDMNDVNKSEPVENFDFIKIFDTNYAFIDTRQMNSEFSSISLNCRAVNSLGQDLKTSTLMAIKRED